MFIVIRVGSDDDDDDDVFLVLVPQRREGFTCTLPYCPCSIWFRVWEARCSAPTSSKACGEDSSLTVQEKKHAD